MNIDIHIKKAYAKNHPMRTERKGTPIWVKNESHAILKEQSKVFGIPMTRIVEKLVTAAFEKAN
jgi:hypothetical protein